MPFLEEQMDNLTYEELYTFGILEQGLQQLSQAGVGSLIYKHSNTIKGVIILPKIQNGRELYQKIGEVLAQKLPSRMEVHFRIWDAHTIRDPFLTPCTYSFQQEIEQTTKNVLIEPMSKQMQGLLYQEKSKFFMPTSNTNISHYTWNQFLRHSHYFSQELERVRSELLLARGYFIHQKYTRFLRTFHQSVGAVLRAPAQLTQIIAHTEFLDRNVPHSPMKLIAEVIPTINDAKFRDLEEFQDPIAFQKRYGLDLQFPKVPKPDDNVNDFLKTETIFFDWETAVGLLERLTEESMNYLTLEQKLPGES